MVQFTARKSTDSGASCSRIMSGNPAMSGSAEIPEPFPTLHRNITWVSL
jgi:hypothetical protein